MKKTKLTAVPHSHLKENLNHAINLPREAYAKQRYNTPLFVAFEMLKAFQRHNAFGLSASLSFYAMFALIPLVLLMFFLLSQLVFSSDYAIVKLAIITGNLVPQLSSAIMVEVYNTAKQQAAWGALGLFILLWSVTPLASSMRSAFYNIASLVEAPSFVKRKFKDIFAILGILLLFFLFTFAGLMLEKVLAFLGASKQLLENGVLAVLISLVLTTALIATFYFVFFPVRLNLKHIITGALFTAILWLLMRPAFTLFLSVNQSYGALFGGMKNLFISITWLYFNFAVFLLGTELIATLRKKDVLLLKGLFENDIGFQLSGKENYIKKLMQSYGKTYYKDDYIFRYGDTPYKLYYLLSGEIQLIQKDSVLRTVEPGSYFGEMAMLSNTPTIADALVISDYANVIIINTDNIETLLLDEPKVAMQFLRQLANRLQRHEE
jgi:membrane protein